jgi:hypothetical protein
MPACRRHSEQRGLAITARAGKRAQLLAALKANVHSEERCIEYVATLDTEGAGRVQTRLGEDTFVVAPEVLAERYRIGSRRRWPSRREIAIFFS